MLSIGEPEDITTPIRVNEKNRLTYSHSGDN